MIENAPFQQPITDGVVNAPSWIRWLTKLALFAGSVSDHGTTSQRPVSGLFVGRRYFDETIGYPIWLKTVNPIEWVDSTGATV